MYLSIVEDYFSVEVTHNLRIALMNNTPNSFAVDFTHFLNIVFSLVFKHKTDRCSVSRLLYPRIACFQIIAR